MNNEWFVLKDTHHQGPFSDEEMVELFSKGEIKSQTLIWKEGNEKWVTLLQSLEFKFLFPNINKNLTFPDRGKNPPTLPFKLPAIPQALAPPIPPRKIVLIHSDDLPPPLPLDAIIDPLGEVKIRIKNEESQTRHFRYSQIIGTILFLIIIGWYVLTQKNAGIQLRIKGIMPVYLDKLDMTATKNTPKFEVEMALSLDGLTLWASSNFGGELSALINLKSVPNRVLGTEDVSLMVRGSIVNHVGNFNKMILKSGIKFLPGEYKIHVEGRQIHFLNRYFKRLQDISFFKSLNKTYSFDGTTLVYPGTPREFEKKIYDYNVLILNEKLKPFQDKLERMQTLESLLNTTSQNYLMDLDNSKKGKDIASFETKFIKDMSPLLQSLIANATEPQLQIGKKIGEMASDMITKTMKFKKLTGKDKNALRFEFNKRSIEIKKEIDVNIKKTEEQLKNISR